MVISYIYKNYLHMKNNIMRISIHILNTQFEFCTLLRLINIS